MNIFHCAKEFLDVLKESLVTDVSQKNICFLHNYSFLITHFMNSAFLHSLGLVPRGASLGKKKGRTLGAHAVNQKLFSLSLLLS